MKRHLPKLLAASLTFLIGVVSAGNFAYQVGRIHAYVDVARGKHELKVAGLMSGDVAEFRKIAANDYGIEVFSHGCVMSTEGFERMRGYNDVSLAAIKRKHGADVIDIIWHRAQNNTERKDSRPKQPRKQATPNPQTNPQRPERTRETKSAIPS